MRIWSTMCAAMLAGIIVQVPAQPRDEPTDVLDKYSALLSRTYLKIADRCRSDINGK